MDKKTMESSVRKALLSMEENEGFWPSYEIFPIDSVKFFCYFAIDGIGGAMRGE